MRKFLDVADIEKDINTKNQYYNFVVGVFLLSF